MNLNEKHISSGSMLRKFGYGGDFDKWADHLAEQLWNAERDLPHIRAIRMEREALQNPPVGNYMIRVQAA